MFFHVNLWLLGHEKWSQINGGVWACTRSIHTIYVSCLCVCVRAMCWTVPHRLPMDTENSHLGPLPARKCLPGNWLLVLSGMCALIFSLSLSPPSASLPPSIYIYTIKCIMCMCVPVRTLVYTCIFTQFPHRSHFHSVTCHSSSKTGPPSRNFTVAWWFQSCRSLVWLKAIGKHRDVMA